eukprot:6185993-Pleurochrysis_carterae.AAC.1
MCDVLRLGVGLVPGTGLQGAGVQAVDSRHSIRRANASRVPSNTNARTTFRPRICWNSIVDTNFSHSLSQLHPTLTLHFYRHACHFRHSRCASQELPYKEELLQCTVCSVAAAKISEADRRSEAS